jgi:hypothetical protein
MLIGAAAALLAFVGAITGAVAVAIMGAAEHRRDDLGALRRR